MTLSRKDILNQAVSLSIASQSGVWIFGKKAVNKSLVYNYLVYDYNHINECLRKTIINNASWKYVLSASGCKYIEMDFDSVRNNIASAVQNIADFIGVEVKPEKIPKEQVTKRQSESINEEWARNIIFDFNRESKLLDKEKLMILRKVKRKSMQMMKL